jgi:hypothetical protein
MDRTDSNSHRLGVLDTILIAVLGSIILGAAFVLSEFLAGLTIGG